MKFSIITPVWNGADKITRTIDSVLSQPSVKRGENQINYIVVDGASEDGTAEVARGYEDPRISVISRPDRGMYDALADGLALADGDVTCYLSAGETYDRNAFEVVSDVFQRYDDINWLTGCTATRNERGQIIESRLPHDYQRRMILTAMHGTRLPFVQQESTFWRTTLNGLIDIERLRQLRFAGDFFIWTEFAREHDLYVVNSILASFTCEPGQLSAVNADAYLEEMHSVRIDPTTRDVAKAFFLRLKWRRIVPFSNTPRLLNYDLNRRHWRLSSE